MTWNPKTRLVVFVLASTSILSLLVELYGVARMSTLTWLVFCPAALALVVLYWRGLGDPLRVGCLAGLGAAVAYDIFRLPFVLGWLPALPLFKVFPLFGAMLLGPEASPLWCQVAGWTYHFCNGATFGLMYVAAIGDPRERSWGWAVVMALLLEAGMLFSPYPQVFGIAMTTKFILTTVAAHGVFGVILGVMARRLS